MRPARLALLAEARKDMIELRRYSLREFGRAAADRYVDDIRSVFLLLRDKPRAGAELSDIAPGLRAFTKRGHRIFYRIVEGTIVIVRILHHSRDVPRHLAP